MSKLYKETVNK